MERLEFQVQGSAEVPYTVVFERRSSNNLAAFCDCAAGSNGQYCKHRFSILDGQTDSIVSDNAADVKIIRDWIVGSDIQAALNAVRVLEEQAAEVKKLLSAAKKKLARTMYD